MTVINTDTFSSLMMATNGWSRINCQQTHPFFGVDDFDPCQTFLVQLWIPKNQGRYRDSMVILWSLSLQAACADSNSYGHLPVIDSYS